MSFIFADSFDHYSTTDISKKWNAVNQPWVITAGRLGGNGLGGGYPFAGIAEGANVATVFSSASNSFIMGAAVNFAASGSGYTIINFFQLSYRGTYQVGLRINFDGTLSIIAGGNNSNGSVTLATSAESIQLNTFNYIELKAAISTSVSAHTVQARVNGVIVCEASAGANTDPAGASTANSAALQFPYFIPGDGSVVFDDFYLCDGTGSTNNDFLGDVAVTDLYPNGNGSTNNFINNNGNSVNNYSHVNADPTNDGATYVQSSNQGDIDLYGFGSLPYSGTVHALQQIIEVEKSDAGARTVAPIINISSNNYQGIVVTPPTSSYLYYMSPYDTNPNTTNPWTDNDVNNAEYGIEIVS